MSTQSNSPQSKEGFFRIFFDLLFNFVFLSVIGVLFVAFCILLGKDKLLILAYVLLSAAVVRPFVPDERMQKLQRVAIIGEGLKIFTHLERYYIQYPPRSIFFYLFFPITGIFSFFFSKDRGRRELKAHFILIQWIIVLLFVQGFASYNRFYQHFDGGFAASWMYMELLAVYFLCNFFAIPAATTPMRLSVSGRRIRLVVVSAMALLVMTGFLYIYRRGALYDNLIPINIAMDRRMDTLKAQEWIRKARKREGDHSPNPKKAIPQNTQAEVFFKKLQQTSEMYVRFLAPQILAFNKAHYFSTPRKHAAYLKERNKEFQGHLKPFSPFEEHKHIFLTWTQESDLVWGMIVMPFRENLFYTFKISRLPTLHPQGHQVHFYRRWEDMPKEDRESFHKRWDKHLFRFAAEKRLARVIVDTMRDFSKKMSTANKSKRANRISVSPMQQTLPPPSVGRASSTTPSQPMNLQQMQKYALHLRKKSQYLETLETKVSQQYKLLVQQLTRLSLASTKPTDTRMTPQEIMRRWELKWFAQRKMPPMYSIRGVTQKLLVIASTSELQKEMRALLAGWRLFQEQMQTPQSLLPQDRERWYKDFRKVEIRLQSILAKQTQQIHFFSTWTQKLQQLQRQRATFVLYNEALRELHLKRAIHGKLLYDHFGKTPTLPQIWWADAYSLFLRLLLFLFQLTMPLHIFLIFYCQARLRDPS